MSTVHNLEQLAQDNQVDLAALRAFCSNNESYYDSISEDELIESFEESFEGEYNSGAEFAEELIISSGYLDDSNLPNWIESHIDYQAIWDRELRHDYYEIDGHYFRNNH